CLQDKQLPLTF
nr:immunoglobulin light chain junction region [Macaca mulatta]MOX27917.1 immunoglobulin light chain junction region [Macaca mulatta]MOX27945.1 immunoglobulin light chain junction region [Macaca mulatta]MOX48153.1 immunoglobulin light chain junction region [Macaca mulatta]MOX48281.1 immunoglobulin light chain junction region [Macaca mulatta]